MLWIICYYVGSTKRTLLAEVLWLLKTKASEIFCREMEENIIIKEDATDRISELPECIIENILLRLDKPKERVRVSVLSRKWFALSGSLPVLKFLFSDFTDEEGCISNRDVRDNFYNYVKHTVSRFCHHQNTKIAPRKHRKLRISK